MIKNVTQKIAQSVTLIWRKTSLNYDKTSHKYETKRHSRKVEHVIKYNPKRHFNMQQSLSQIRYKASLKYDAKRLSNMLKSVTQKYET